MKDLTNLKTYIVDSEDPQEIDDAISIEIEEGKRYKLWVHISNPTELFEFNSSIDIEARKKYCSLYLTDEYISMLPKSIIDKANLTQNKISNTISASIEFNEDGSINKYHLMEAIIKPKYQLTYEDVNEILELEPKEEKEIIEIKNLLLKSKHYREKKGALSFENIKSKIKLNKGEITLSREYKTMSEIIISEAMILMGYVTSLYLFDNNLVAPYRIQQINCNAREILTKYNDSQIKYIILKQYMGKSFTTTKPNKHECLGLKMYLQSTSPLRRYLDLIVQRQVYNKLNNKKQIDKDTIIEIIEYSKVKQVEINNIYKNDKLKYLFIFFNNENKKFYKLIFVRWINQKRNIALVYFPNYLLEILITLYVSIDIYSNNVYKVKYNSNDKNLLEFIY